MSKKDVCKLYKKIEAEEFWDVDAHVYRLNGFDTIKEILNEAKYDILPEKYWFDWAHTPQDSDGQIIKDYKNLLLKLEKWFGQP